MKNRHQSKPLTHKTDYASQIKPRFAFVFGLPGSVYEYIGPLDSKRAVVRVPGYVRCFLFDVDDLDFCPSLGQNVFIRFSDDSYAAKVVDYWISSTGILQYKVRIYDVRWNDVVRVITVTVDDLDF